MTIWFLLLYQKYASSHYTFWWINVQIDPFHSNAHHVFYQIDHRALVKVSDLFFSKCTLFSSLNKMEKLTLTCWTLHEYTGIVVSFIDRYSKYKPSYYSSFGLCISYWCGSIRPCHVKCLFSDFCFKNLSFWKSCKLSKFIFLRNTLKC